MIKFSKKTAFYLALIMCIFFVFSIRDVNWDLVNKGENIYRELSFSISFLILTVYFILYYVRKLKELN